MDLITGAMTEKQLNIYRKFKEGKMIIKHVIHDKKDEAISGFIACYFMRKAFICIKDSKDIDFVSNDILDGYLLMSLANIDNKCFEFLEINFENEYDYVRRRIKKGLFINLGERKFYFKNKKFYVVKEGEKFAKGLWIKFERFLQHLIMNISVNERKIDDSYFYEKAAVDDKTITVENIEEI